MADARLKLVERGEYTVDANGQFITPLEAVEAEAKKLGSSKKPSSKKSKDSSSFVEGKVYEDASGNKAKYVGGKWEPA